MKRVVLIFTLFLFTLSNAFHPESLDLTTRILNHYHHDDHEIKPSSDGSDSSNILLSTVSSTVPDHTQSNEVIKEAVSEPEVVPEKLNPVQTKNRFSYQVYRINPIRCRQFYRFMRHSRRFGGVNELGFDPVLNYVVKNRDAARNFPEVERAIRMFGQDQDMGPLHHPHHHHHDHDHVDDDDDDDDDDHWVEMKDHHEERENDVEKKDDDDDDDDEHEDHHEKRKVKDVLKKKHKHKHDHDDDDDEHEDHKKRKVKHVLKKKRKDKDDDDDMVKGVMKKIRKFMSFF